MTRKEQTLRTARIVDYDRYRREYIQLGDVFKLLNNERYEYVQYSIKTPIEGCPNCFTTVHYWKKGQWNDTWRGFAKEDLKQKLMDNEIRMRKKLTTKYLRGLLETEALKFEFDNMQVIVFPKDTDNKEDMMPENDVYVNNIHQRRIPFDSDLNKQWTGRHKENPELRQDWRCLLNLDLPKHKDLDLLYEYFEGVYTGTREDFCPKSPVENNIKKLPRKEKKKLSNRKGKNAKNLRRIQKSIGQAHYIGCKRRKSKTYSDLSKPLRLEKFTKNSLNEAKAKRIRRRVAQEISAFNKKQKKRSEIEIKNEINRKEQAKLAMVCIEDTKTGEIFRVKRLKAVVSVENGFRYVAKHRWKAQKRQKRKELAALTTKAAEPFTGSNRRQRRTVLQSKPLGNMYAKYLTIKFKPLADYVTKLCGFAYKTIVIHNYDTSSNRPTKKYHKGRKKTNRNKFGLKLRRIRKSIITNNKGDN